MRQDGFSLRKGGTLAEVIVSALILGLLVVPSLNVYAHVAHAYFEQGLKDKASLLANELIEEILQLPFEDPESTDRQFGTEPNETQNNRTTLDDVDDYHDYKEGALQFKDGTPIPNTDGFTRMVHVSYVQNSAGALANAISPSDLKRIEVIVNGPNSTYLKLSAIRSAKGLVDKKRPYPSQELTRIRTQIQLGADHPVSTGANAAINRFPLNQN